MADEDGEKTIEGGPVDRSAGAGGQQSDTDYYRASEPARNRLAWQVLIWPLALILLIVLGAVLAFS